MDILKKLFPFSFPKKEIKCLLISIAIYLVIAIVCALVLWLISKVPVVNIICGIVGTIAEIYCVAGIIVSVLSYLGVFDKN